MSMMQHDGVALSVPYPPTRVIHLHGMVLN